MKLVTYSEHKPPLRTRPALLWGEWILDIHELTRVSAPLGISIPRTIQTLSKNALSTLDVLAKGPKVLEDLQKLSWRTFNRIDPVTIPRTMEKLSEVRIRPPNSRPPLIRSFYAFEDQVKAESHIAGYTIMNDWSARDIQQPEMKIGLGPAKAKDFANAIGPWLVTPDELQDKKIGPGKFDLQMKATVNGKQLSDGNMKKMCWTFQQMIARASQSVELRVGEIFGSGTVGTGSLLELGQEVHPWLKPGDHVELEIERLGVLRNRIIETAKS